MKWARRLILVAILAILGIWILGWLFPGPEKLVRARLARTAQLTSPGGLKAVLSNADSLSEFGGCFSPEATVSLELQGYGQLILTNREEILIYSERTRAMPVRAKVEFLDVDVMLEADKQSATATLTARITVPGDRDFTVQGMKFWLKKFGKDWLIIRVETVRTLASHNRLTLTKNLQNS